MRRDRRIGNSQNPTDANNEIALFIDRQFGDCLTPRGGLALVTLRSAGPDCEIAVTDTGTGIASDMLPFVFDRFWRADTSPGQRFSGLGLGLALAKRLVELHGGTVTATSAGPNQGSTFTVILPRVAPRASSPDQHSTSVHNAADMQYDAHVNVNELQGD